MTEGLSSVCEAFCFEEYKLLSDAGSNGNDSAGVILMIADVARTYSTRSAILNSVCAVNATSFEPQSSAFEPEDREAE